MNPAYKRFVNKWGAAADAVARLDIQQIIREEVADALTEAFRGQADFIPDTFRLLASDPLCLCAGDLGPCPDGREIRIAMHLSDAPDGRSEAWASRKPLVRCVSCGAGHFIGRILSGDQRII